jgi:hypothetical protein
MSEHTDEASLNNQSISSSENPSAEIITETKQDVENMEVHHHAHHGGKKTWKSYFWEFLMLFLAVFCGFMAEYQLEHVIENQKEKEYINSMVEDLKADTAQANSIFKNINKRAMQVDSLLTELAGTAILSNSNNAFRLWNEGRGFPDFIYTDRTIQQLKNSGSLRLIRNHEVSDSIIYFDRLVRTMLVEQNLMNEYLNDRSQYNAFFNFIAFRKNENTPVPLMGKNKESLNKIYADQEFWKSRLLRYAKRIKIINQTAGNLIGFIKTKYELN